MAATASEPSRPWTPPKVEAPKARSAEIPAELTANRTQWTLGDLVDLALRNSNETRASWEAARAAAAHLGSSRGAYLPQIDFDANYTRQKTAALAGRTQTDQRFYGGSFTLDWLLFNFGGRHAEVEESRQALIAADWEHNATIQRVILDVQRGYFDYSTATALLRASDSSIEEARKNLDVAQARHDGGLATIADVLQAKTALAQAQLEHDTAMGRIQTTRGALATAVGLPANTTFEVEIDEGPPPIVDVDASIESYLEQARAERPDLWVARAEAERAHATARRTRAEGYPEIRLLGNVGRTYLDSPDRGQDTRGVTLGLSVPLFSGFSHYFDLREAEADARAADARAAGVEQEVVLQVWTSYFDLKTAAQRLRTSDDLIASATESQEVAQGRYRAGVGSILDLLSAQAALESARAVQVQARADWYLALAQLSHDTGTLRAGAISSTKDSTR